MEIDLDIFIEQCRAAKWGSASNPIQMIGAIRHHIFAIRQQHIKDTESSKLITTLRNIAQHLRPILWTFGVTLFHLIQQPTERQFAVRFTDWSMASSD
ncbi:Uncharacterised protein [Vibrio cholerae]|nr:Uncharacterised protein [Vibrio cholerae]CSI56614.1 Uncharacterised protein [Vibrio cholerae]